MNRENKYYTLLHDLHRYSTRVSSTELEHLVQRALIAMALDVADKEPISIKPLTAAGNGSNNLNVMLCKTI